MHVFLQALPITTATVDGNLSGSELCPPYSLRDFLECSLGLQVQSHLASELALVKQHLFTAERKNKNMLFSYFDLSLQSCICNFEPPSQNSHLVVPSIFSVHQVGVVPSIF